MKQTNLSVFITHKGCPHICSFCNQKEINESEAVTPEQLEALLSGQIENLRHRGIMAEIAFFGGSFTAVDREYMVTLLKTAQSFCREYPDVYNGIRCSTRPDCINDEILSLLRDYGMTAIELGAQSMDERVLLLNRRGHTAEDVRRASALIKQYGFSLGLQMMTGLYGDSAEGASYTAAEFVKLKPDTVRIYPTVILKNTYLGELFLSGKYVSLGFDKTVSLCAELLRLFENAGIRVIRLGLHRSEGIEKNMLGGVYHPAFRELCEGELFYNELLQRFTELGGSHYKVYSDRSNTSKLIGQQGRNRKRLAEKGFTFEIIEKNGVHSDIEVSDVL